MFSKRTIGLDWDGTVSDHVEVFSLLSDFFHRCVIITLNPTITREYAAQVLRQPVDKVHVEICDDESLEEYPQWKAAMCHKHTVDVMFDDDHYVVEACQAANIRAMRVGEHPVLNYASRLLAG